MPRGGARPGAGRPRKNADDGDAKPATKKSSKPPAAVDAEGFKTADAPPGWPFGKERPEDLSEMTPLDLLLQVVRDRSADMRLRLQAANIAAPYVHQKKGEGGKKEERQAAAQKAAGSGRFGPATPPKLIASGGKKV